MPGAWLPRNGFIQRCRRNRRADAAMAGISQRRFFLTEGGQMPSQLQSPLRVGQVLEIRFPPFTPRITIRSERELTVEIIAGDNAGFSDTIAYEAVTVRDGLVVLTWQEHIGSTVAHVLDYASGEAFTAVTPAKGAFMRLRGKITVRSAG
jgi:hypothetical protein